MLIIFTFLHVYVLYVCFCTVDVCENSVPSTTEEEPSSAASEQQLVKRPRIGRTNTLAFTFKNQLGKWLLTG